MVKDNEINYSSSGKPNKKLLRALTRPLVYLHHSPQFWTTRLSELLTSKIFEVDNDEIIDSDNRVKGIVEIC